MAIPLNKDGEEIHKQLGNEISTIAVKFDQFSQLYLNGQETLNLLAKAAPLYFEFTGESLIRDIVMSIARLSDHAQTMNKDNLTFARLSNELTGQCKAHFDAELKHLQNRMEKIKLWRNKHLAHNDLNHSLNRVALPNLDYDNIKECVKISVVLLNVVNAYTGESQTLYDQVVQSGGASALLVHLQSAFGRYTDWEKEGSES
jgi:hypothetical protein